MASAADSTAHEDDNCSDSALLLPAAINSEDGIASEGSAVFCGRRQLMAIALGQLVSIILCSTGLLTKLLVKRGFEGACIQILPMYALLALIYVPILMNKGVFWPTLKSHGFRFAFLALVDVEGNYILVTAYQYTNFTSAQLLDCTSIVFVLVLSRIFLKTRYSIGHLVGAAVCVLGMGGIIAADAVSAGEDARAVGPNPVLGDILCISAAFLYACSNVGEEYIVRNMDMTYFLGFVGLFGTIINGIQTAIVDRENIANIEWTTPVVVLYCGFTLVLALMYSIVPVMIKRSSAVMFNLSLLTADVYSFVIGLLLFKINFYWLYFPAFFLVLLGLVLYTRAPEHKSIAIEKKR